MSDIQKRLEKAEKYLQKGRQEDALQEYLQALNEDPHNDNVRQTAADLSIALGRTSDAAVLLSELFDKQATTNDATRAVANFKKLARIGTPTVDQAFRYGQLVEKTSKRDAHDAYAACVQGFTAAGRKQDALAVLKRIVAMEPNEANFTREGILAAELGDGKTASAAFLKVGELQPAGADPTVWFERAYQMDPQSAGAALRYAKCLLAGRRAAEAITVLAPTATLPTAPIPVREVYGKALVAAGHLAEAEPFIWALYEADPKQEDEVANLIGALLDADLQPHALELTHKFESAQIKSGNQREFVTRMKEISDGHRASVDFLEYMVEVFNAANREHDYCETLLKLFELYYAGGNFIKAADCLDRAAEVDPYEPGHERRLDMLRGKVDNVHFNAIASRFNAVLKIEDKDNEEEAAPDEESTVLEDLMLQAEIFIQYSMRSKAVERLERISKLFPHEEDKNEQLRTLFMNAGYTPHYPMGSAPRAPQPPAATPAPVAAAPVAPTPQAPPPPPTVPAAVANENAVDNFARVTDITRNIYRQGSVKGVLFTAVNEIGRHWNASRCVAALITPGKPPSTALEYCAPGIPAADVMTLVKLVQATQNIAVSQGTVSAVNVPGDDSFDASREVFTKLQIESLLAEPLMDGDEHAGILILEQVGAPRKWHPTDEVVLKTIAEQMILAVNNARLRSLVKTLAVTEEKSGLLKRSSYLDVLLSETKRSLEQDTPLTIMLLHFGKTSAMVREYGESAVDGMMQQIGQVLTSHIRQTDVAVRYDLTTIALVLADTAEKNAFFVVDKMRRVLGAVHLPGKSTAPGITIGIAEAVLNARFDPTDIVTEVINRAETAMEAAKAEGPNAAKCLSAPVLETVAASAD